MLTLALFFSLEILTLGFYNETYTTLLLFEKSLFFFDLKPRIRPEKFVGNFLTNLWKLLCLPEVHLALDYNLEFRFTEDFSIPCMCILDYHI